MFPDWRGNEIDFTHPFVISYENKIGKQIELDTHMGKFYFKILLSKKFLYI